MDILQEIFFLFLKQFMIHQLPGILFSIPHTLTMYYNGLVISHKRNVNFLAENDGVLVGNFRYTWSQVSFVYVCVYIFLRAHVRVYIC